jgi:glucosyl-dolichyl phosphate glucuronosyltransferase
VGDRERFSIVIATHNRSALLAGTLESLASMTTPGRWEAIVVDNASTDDTRAVVARFSRTFPARLTYLAEPVPGKYRAVNRGVLAAVGEIIAATDDDALVGQDWLDRADEGFRRFRCDFVGGPVKPIWGAPPPAWLSETSGLHGKIIALQDHGREPREYGCAISWPLGVNVAYRRDVFERVGLFDPDLGRIAGTLRNQAQREWHLRARTVGVRGYYLPDMQVRHHVPVERLTRAYFRRWCYWHGISRVLLSRRGGYCLEEPDTRDRSSSENAGAAARPLLEKAMRSAAALAWHSVRGERAAALTHELRLCFFAGVARESMADRWLPWSMRRSRLATRATAAKV